MKSLALTFRFLSLLIATNYFAYRVELFRDEYEQNHPQASTSTSFTVSSLNWETFDKDNASKSFVFDGRITIELIGASPREHREPFQYYPQYRLVLDKSPPVSPSPV